MSLAATYARIRSGIVAFFPTHYEQIAPKSSPFEHIFGTGFVVGDSLIATNAHVVKHFQQYQLPGKNHFDVSALFFIRVPQGMASPMRSVLHASYVSGIRSTGFTYGGPVDLGLVSVECKGLSKYVLNV